MSKLTAKDWIKLLGIYSVGFVILGLFFLFIKGVQKGWIFLGLDQWKLNISLPTNTHWYLLGVIGFGTIYFFVEDLVKHIRGYQDPVLDKELPLDEQVMNEIVKEYDLVAPPVMSKTATLPHETLKKELAQTKIDPSLQERIMDVAKNQNFPVEQQSKSPFDREFRYSPIVYYWIIGILLFGLISEWGISLYYPQEAAHLGVVTLSLLSICAYLFFLAQCSVRYLCFDSKHVWMGSSKNQLYCEKDYGMMYYMNSRTLTFFREQKNYNMLVFRKAPCFAPLAYFIDRLFPASNENRQVVFFNVWKDEEGVLGHDALLVKGIIDRCKKNGVKISYWPSEAQFFLIIILVVVFFSSWMILR